MRALTLWRPWPWAIIEAGKRIENRPWRPPSSLLKPGERFALHAGKTWDESGRSFIERVSGRRPLGQSLHPFGIVAVARFEGVVREDSSPWFFGPFGWLLEDVVALPEAVPCKGAQGLWEVPPAVLQQVLEQLSASPGAKRR